MEVLFILTILIILIATGGIIILFIKLLLETKTPREVYQDGKGLMHEARKSGNNFYKNFIPSEDGKFQEIDEELFRIAYNEIVNSNKNEDLWIKSLVLAGGNKDRQEIEYIKLRVVQLKNF